MWAAYSTTARLISDFNNFIRYAQACCLALVLALVITLASTSNTPLVLYHYCLILAIGITATLFGLLLRITFCFKIMVVLFDESIARARDIGKNVMGVMDATVAKYYPKESEKKE